MPYGEYPSTPMDSTPVRIFHPTLKESRMWAIEYLGGYNPFKLDRIPIYETAKGKAVKGWVTKTPSGHFMWVTYSKSYGVGEFALKKDGSVVRG